MANYFSERLVVYGENQDAVLAKVQQYRETASAGQAIELVKSASNALYYRSLTKSCRLLAIVFELLSREFPLNTLALSSNLEMGETHAAVRREGRELFYARGYAETSDEWTQMLGGEENCFLHAELMSFASDDVTGDVSPSILHTRLLDVAIAHQKDQWQTWLAGHNEAAGLHMQVVAVGKPDGTLASVSASDLLGKPLITALAGVEDITDEYRVVSATVSLDKAGALVSNEFQVHEVARELNQTVVLRRMFNDNVEYTACPLSRIGYGPSVGLRYFLYAGHQVLDALVPQRLRESYKSDAKAGSSAPVREFVVTTHELVLALKEALFSREHKQVVGGGPVSTFLGASATSSTTSSAGYAGDFDDVAF
jgi:hypothetical protein